MKRMVHEPVVDDEHALVVGGISMVLMMAEDRLGGLLYSSGVSVELDSFAVTAQLGDVFGSSITLEVDGVPRYRVHVEALRDEAP